MPEFEQRRQRRLGTHGTIEPSPDREHVAAGHGERSGAGSVAGAYPSHVPAVQRELRVPERHAHRGVPEHAVANGALAPRAEIVGSGRRVDERTAEVLPCAERPFDAEPPAHFAAWAHFVAALNRHVACGVPVARAHPQSPVLTHLDGGRKTAGKRATRAKTRRREPEEMRARRPKQWDRRIGHAGRARRDRADEIEHQLPWNDAVGSAQIGVDDSRMRDRGRSAADCGDGRAREGGAEIEDQPAARNAPRDADRNRELAEAIECEPRAEGVGFERDARACDRGLRGEHSRKQQASEAAARERHGRRKMIRMMPVAWMTLQMPWLSGVGFDTVLLMPFGPATSPTVADTSTVTCFSAPSAAGPSGGTILSTACATATTSPGVACTAGAASAACRCWAA